MEKISGLSGVYHGGYLAGLLYLIVLYSNIYTNTIKNPAKPPKNTKVTENGDLSPNIPYYASYPPPPLKKSLGF